MMGNACRLLISAILASLAVAGLAAAAEAAEARPAFDFLGQDTETQTTMTEIMGKECTQEGAELECKSFGGEIAGVKLKYIVMKFHEGKLYSIYGAIWDHGLGDMLAAFSAKYGNPVAEQRTWQNKRGSTFANPTFVWTFKCGTLELESLGWDIDSSSFEFACDANRPPPEEPVVDF